MSDAQQQAAILKTKQAARAQARLDMHNAARQVMSVEGLSVSDLKKEAAAMVERAATAALNDMVQNGNLEKVIEKIVKEEISRAFGLKDAFKNAFEGAVRRQFAVYADDFIKNNLSIRVIDGNGPQAGSF